jgi:hypothetical protein
MPQFSEASQVALFNRYIGVDYSGEVTPVSSLKVFGFIRPLHRNT